LRFGIAGTLVAGICCVTPVIVWGLAGLGLSGLTGYIYSDDVLLPLLAAFLMVTGYALWKRRKQK
jgi:mercuric ion transport protein